MCVKETDVSQEIHSTDCTPKESNVDIQEATLGNLKNKEESLSVDSILEPTLAVMDLDSFILNYETHEC